MFPKNEKHRFSVSDIFSTLLQPCFFQWSKAVCVNFHRPTYQEFTPTSNIALLILCSRQAIVPLCRPGGVRAARFNPPPPFRGTGVPNTTSSPASSKASAGPAHSAGPPPKYQSERPSSLKISTFSIFDPPLLDFFVFLRAHFSIFFSHRFFFDFGINFGSILGQVLVILGSFWHPFFEHRFCTDFWLIFHRVLEPLNLTKCGFTAVGA